MKYRFKIDYIPKEGEEVRVLEPLIRKGEVLDVVGYSEPIQSVVCYYKKGIQVNIPLQVFLLIAEEYQEPRKPKVCVRCKRFKKCKQSTMNTRTWLNSGLGSCAIFEEKE